MIEFVTPDGSVYVEEPPGFDWDKALNPPVEGQLYYKGFIAQYWRGDEEDGEHDLYVADMANIHEAAFVMQGYSLQELTQDFHEMVDDFLMEVDNGGYGGHPIEYYTNDPNILEYYNRYHRNKGIFNLETMINIHKAVLKLETA